mmetsp:Transcript_18188/g.36747  ORF Transcript_18188/g.36747 Transcript_18188/m.36747 type:complete len:144 (-) Transcript_18188:2525-2956(-)
MHLDEEQAQREEDQRQREAREARLNSAYERGEHFTQEQHDAMYEAIKAADMEVRLVPGGANNLFYCLQRWAQGEGHDYLYGRTVEQTGIDRGVDWNDEEAEPVMTLVWVNDAEEGSLNHRGEMTGLWVSGTGRSVSVQSRETY